MVPFGCTPTRRLAQVLENTIPGRLVERTAGQVALVRLIGEWSGLWGDDSPESPVVAAVAAPNVPMQSPDDQRSGSGAGGDAVGLTAASLPISGYDDLAASQIVDRLTGLDAQDLVAIDTYERAHRARRTVLGRIQQLADPTGRS